MAFPKARRPRPASASAKPRKRRYDYEGREQTQLVNWLKGCCLRGTLPAHAYKLLYAVPNGGSRHSAEAVNLRAQGVRAGVSDLVLAMPRGGYAGLYLELKATPPHNATISDEQKKWCALVNAEGYLGVVAIGVESAKQLLRWYIEQPASSGQPPTPLPDQLQEAQLC
ncbi:VRR-NUC domain-containing protein [Carnimonas bestiolae]|uniref:VRR-NUC domain-containing protein n=1 Tax=Carnimonas bestiolae TaxID=3402172 RepID=UPI003F4AAF79